MCWIKMTIRIQTGSINTFIMGGSNQLLYRRCRGRSLGWVGHSSCVLRVRAFFLKTRNCFKFKSTIFYLATKSSKKDFYAIRLDINWNWNQRMIASRSLHCRFNWCWILYIFVEHWDRGIMRKNSNWDCDEVGSFDHALFWVHSHNHYLFKIPN